MNTSNIALKLESFTRKSFQIADDDPDFSRSVHLFEEGYVDSIGVIEMLTFITETFGVQIPDDALQSDGFATIDGMAQVIAELMAPADAKAAVTAS